MVLVVPVRPIWYPGYPPQCHALPVRTGDNHSPPTLLTPHRRLSLHPPVSHYTPIPNKAPPPVCSIPPTQTLITCYHWCVTHLYLPSNWNPHMLPAASCSRSALKQCITSTKRTTWDPSEPRFKQHPQTSPPPPWLFPHEWQEAPWQYLGIWRPKDKCYTTENWASTIIWLVWDSGLSCWKHWNKIKYGKTKTNQQKNNIKTYNTRSWNCTTNIPLSFCGIKETSKPPSPGSYIHLDRHCMPGSLTSTQPFLSHRRKEREKHHQWCIIAYFQPPPNPPY